MYQCFYCVFVVNRQIYPYKNVFLYKAIVSYLSLSKICHKIYLYNDESKKRI